MHPQRRAASPFLRSLVQGYEERAASFGREHVTHPLPARPDHFIEIYCAERYRISQNDSAPAVSPEISVVGPHGHGRTRLILSGDVLAFSIRLQPGALRRMSGIDMPELANRGVSLPDISPLGHGALRDGVLAAEDFAGRIAAAERWLAGFLDTTVHTEDMVDVAARLMLRARGNVRVARLAAWAGLSERHFSRRFLQQTGLSPKLYARTSRLNAVLDARTRRPTAPWTELSHAAGYTDQAHFIRDCRELTGASPSAFFPAWSQLSQT